MSEINNDGIKFNTRKDIGFKGQKHCETKQEVAPEQIISDLGNNPSELLGRSMIKKVALDKSSNLSGLEANIRKDLEVLKQNPDLVQLSDIMFEKTLNAEKKNGSKDAYATATAVQSAFVNELKPQ